MNGAILNHAKVRRGGVTSPYRNVEMTQVSLKVCKNAIEFDFTLSSKGGGETQVHLEIGPADFGAILKTMVRAARIEGMKSMAATLAEQAAALPIHEERAAQRARQDVVELAQKKFDEAPSDNDDVERLVWERVKKLVTELSEVSDADQKAA